MGRLNFQGVVFDADGVLFDTEQLHRSAWVVIGKEMGCPQVVDHYLDCIGKTRADIRVLMRDATGPDFPMEEFFSRVSELCLGWLRQDVPMKPGVRELLDFLKEHNIPVGMATSTYRDRTMLRLEKTGLTPYFHSITTGDEVHQGKPNPEIYLTACRKLGIDPSHTIAIEDSRNGILSAHGAGMQVIMVPDLIPPSPDLDALLFKRFDSLMDVRAYLDTLF